MEERKKQYGLIGERLGHSFSPGIHKQLGDYPYDLIELTQEALGPFLQSQAFQGLNVTIPYKKTVIPYCKRLTPQAQRIGSVNTIIRQKDGSLLGHNTDYDGFTYLLREAGAQVAGKKALVLGTGGASLTVNTVLQDLGVGELVSISRNGPNNYENLDLHQDAQIIVNATPVGMYPNTGISPVDLDLFPLCEGVFDLIYNPAKTQLLLEAERRGIPCANGLGMLVAQAKAAAEYFLDQPIADERVMEIKQEMEKQTRNLLLIGMPGCGKTTVGHVLAQRLHRELVDTDRLIEQEAGCSIPELFTGQGEEVFRQIEHKVLCEVAKRSGLVIATGGGVVTRADNMDPIRQNSTVVFLQRALDQLPLAGRPISQKNSVTELYRQRLPRYQGLADLEVDNVVVEHAVTDIVKQLRLQ